MRTRRRRPQTRQQERTSLALRVVEQVNHLTEAERIAVLKEAVRVNRVLDTFEIPIEQRNAEQDR